MPKQEVYHIHPLGWEHDPEEERYRLSAIDYIATCTFNNYGLFFRLDDADKNKAVEALRHGLARTLSQTRHLCCTIEQDPNGDHSFVRRKADTVELHVQWLDAPEDADKYPSLEDLQDSHFTTRALGDLDLWRIPHMKYGQYNADARPGALKAVMALKASFIRGGMLLNIQMHHYSNDLAGWANFTHQLADNCHAFLTGTAYPPWDPDCLDVSRFTKPPVPENQKIDLPGPLFYDPAVPLPLPGGSQNLLFHLPKSKAAQLKALAQAGTPIGSRISTYDAFVALLWQILTRLRQPHYPSLPQDAVPFWAGMLDMRKRLQTPDHPIPQRMQRNLIAAAVSHTPPPTARGSRGGGGWSLPRLAAHMRAMTEGTGTQAALDEMLELIRVVRDKVAAAPNLHRLAALAHIVTDHRPAGTVTGAFFSGAEEGADFGFGKVVAYRQLWGRANVGMVVIYAPRVEGGEDEGYEVTIGYEKVLAKELLEDEEWGRWFEYRGLDWEDV
ncbi:hypothetical protein C8A01DRAFT_33648 [Parachaetomium inaequale]|uniref:Trichothecene 3-O-acetyltransferase-like N-terminal domain-containing protein n=1 Tax=Parachaetomium inaequale TaxID=2588326 RepID=A0AAN6PNC1_9PEZI|nr:hypothetical protein C8A01DRAFT_33648 [Parachaetomium inaequale]